MSKTTKSDKPNLHEYKLLMGEEMYELLSEQADAKGESIAAILHQYITLGLRLTRDPQEQVILRRGDHEIEVIIL